MIFEGSFHMRIETYSRHYRVLDHYLFDSYLTIRISMLIRHFRKVLNFLILVFQI
jgi:hypothetical protein